MKPKFWSFKKLSTNLIVVSLTLLYSSCQKDELVTENSNAFGNEIVSKSKEYLEANNSDLTILKYTKNILWDKAIISNGEKGQIIEVPLVLLDNVSTINDKQSQHDYHRLLFMRDNENVLKVYHLQIITKLSTFNNLSRDFNFYNIKANFDGKVTIFDENKQTIDYIQFTDGKRIKPTITSRMAMVTCTYLGYWYEDGHFQSLALLSCDSGGGGSDEWGTNYGHLSSGGSGSKTVANTIEENIDYSQLDACPKAVFEKLKNASSSDIVNILNNLGANSIYKVNIVMKPATTYAEAQRISKNNYEIRVNRDSYTDGTTLFKATALIHEVIHAYFLSIVDDYNNNYPTNAPMADFPSLFEAYVKKTYPNSNSTRDAQHKAMADKYVDAMASALQEFDANYTVPYQVYKDLAWGGLSGAPIFDETFKPGSEESIRIINRFKCESLGRAVEMGTPNQQTPVGKKCN
jgi:hypothetical protein